VGPAGSAAGRGEAAAEGEPAFARVVDEHQVAAVELLEPPPPLDRVEVFAGVGRVVAAEADAVGAADDARRVQTAARRPVVDRVVVGGLVDGHAGGDCKAGGGGCNWCRAAGRAWSAGGEPRPQTKDLTADGTRSATPQA